MTDISIVEGDITKADVDVIVNAANTKMLGGGGVDGAIHKAAGPSLLTECRNVAAVKGVRCPTGEARITRGGNLTAKYVIHTVGPIYNASPDAATLLTLAYKNSLDLALSNKCRSIAFPAISCGIYGYPAREAAQIALEVCQRKQYSDLKIYFYLYGTAMFEIWRTILKTQMT